MILKFIYNIFLIFLFAYTVSLTTYSYIKSKKKIYLILSIYILFFIFDNTIIYMTEFINSFAYSYNKGFMTMPVLKTIIYIVNYTCMFLIVHQLFNNKFKKLHLIMLIVLGIWLIISSFLKTSATAIWLYYLPNQLLTIYIGFYCLYELLTKKELSKIVHHYSKIITILLIIFGFLTLVEDTYVIFNVDKYSNLSIEMDNRNRCEDIYSVIICIVIIKHCLFDSHKKKNNFEDNIDENELFRLFSLHYNLTEREQEILVYLLKELPNNEIADELYISIGTVKTHVHNIFVKVNIKKRGEIISVYNDFIKNKI